MPTDSTDFPTVHPAECQSCIDAVLGSLAFRYQEAADHLLDLKLDTLRRKSPGHCIESYFWLVERLPRSCRAELNQIRVWLEGLIEVNAFKDAQEPFGRLALHLEADSLEDYCARAMQYFRRATVHAPCDLELRFAFRL